MVATSAKGCLFDTLLLHLMRCANVTSCKALRIVRPTVRNSLTWGVQMKARVLRPRSIYAASPGFLIVCLSSFLCLSAPTAYAQTFLSNAELLEILPGATIYSKTDRGKPWAQIYSEPDGKIKGTIRSIFGKRRHYAKWYVRDGQWCENWGVGEACWHVEKVGFQTLRMYTLDGKPRRNFWMLKRKDITG